MMVMRTGYGMSVEGWRVVVRFFSFLAADTAALQQNRQGQGDQLDGRAPNRNSELEI